MAAALSSVEAGIVATLAPALQAKAKAHRAAVLAAGVPFRFTSGGRTRAQQQALYNARSSSAYPVALPGTSMHEKRLAYDASGPRTAAEWQTFGRAAEKLGLTWGGRWSGNQYDPVHVELRQNRILTYATPDAWLAAALVGAFIAAAIRKRKRRP